MNFIVVVDKNYGIGKNNALLTYLPEDLKYFKNKTVGKVIVMGRKTLESLPNCKPLPNRTTIVVTQNKDFKCDNVIIVNSIEDLKSELAKYKDEDIFIAGGSNIYDQLIPLCKYGYITKIEKEFHADKFIVDIDELPHWEQIWESEIKEYKDIEYKFTTYENELLKS